MLGQRDLFPTLAARVYMNHASIAPPSTPVIEAVQEWMALYAREGLGAYTPAAEQRTRLKAMLAGLLGCAPTDLAFTSATSHGLLQLAQCIPFEPGHEILCFRGEFPANTSPWRHGSGATVRFIEQEGRTDADVLTDVEQALKRGRVRLIAASAVQFSTGRAMPLKGLADLAHAHGAELAVDGIQAIGIMPIDVVALGIDYLASGAHKWTMGIEGTGFVYIAPDRVRSLRRKTASWLSLDEPLRFLLEGAGHLQYDKNVRHEASFMEGHSLSAIGCVALEAGLRTILDIGLDAVNAHVRAINDRLENGLVERGFTSLRPPNSPSGTLSVRPPTGTHPLALTEGLAEHGISVSAPDGKIRFSPHWPNAQHDVECVLDAIDALQVRVPSP